AASIANVPPASSASSSGCAKSATTVLVIPHLPRATPRAHAAARSRAALAARYPPCQGVSVRIALVSDVYLPRLGGIEVQVADLAKHLRAAGHEVRVVTATPGPSAEGVARLVPPVPLPAPVNPWAGPALRAELGAADVVHVHLGVVAPFASTAAKIALAARRPTVVTWHSLLSGVPIPYAGRWRRWMQGGVVRTAVSAAAAEQVRTVTRLPSPIDVLPNGISVDDGAALDALPSRLRPGDPVRMVSAIRFARRKRPLQLIRLARRIRRLVPSDLPLELVGAGASDVGAPVRCGSRSADGSRRRVLTGSASRVGCPARSSRGSTSALTSISTQDGWSPSASRHLRLGRRGWRSPAWPTRGSRSSSGTGWTGSSRLLTASWPTVSPP